MSVKDLATKNTKDTKKAWPLVRLGDVCENSIKRLRQIDDEEFEYIDISSIDRSLKTITECKVISRNNAPSRAQQVIEQGDVLVSTVRPNLNAVAMVGEKIQFQRIGSTGFCVLRAAEKILPSYIFRVVQTEGFINSLVRVAEKAAYPSVTDDEVKAFQFPLPPLTVQREIVARLEKELGEADKLAAKFKRVAELADDAFKAELDETFKALEDNSRRDAETRRVRLGDVFDFIDYRGKTPLKTESGVPLITAKNIRQGYLDYHESFYISKKEYATRQTRGIAHKGDILFTTEAPLGLVALADKEEFSTGQRVITFQWKVKGEKACNKYYLYCLLSDWFQGTLRRQATGATAKGIKASRLIDLHVLRVPFSVQEEIVAKLDAAKERCEKLKAAAMRGHAAAENLRKAILAEAFEQ